MNVSLQNMRNVKKMKNDIFCFKFVYLSLVPRHMSSSLLDKFDCDLVQIANSRS